MKKLLTRLGFKEKFRIQKIKVGVKDRFTIQSTILGIVWSNVVNKLIVQPRGTPYEFKLHSDAERTLKTLSAS